MPVAVLVFDAGVGKLDVSVVVRELVVNGPTMDLLRRSIGPSVALGLAAIALLQELLVLALQLIVENDAADEGTVFAEALRILEIGSIDLRIVHHLARPVHGKTGVACASRAGIELLPGLWLLRSAALVVNIAPVAELLLHARQSQCFALHVGPAVAFEYVSSSLGQHDQRAVVAGGRDGLDEPRVFEVPQIAPVRVERTVLAVAKIAGGHDAEGADGGERANLRAAQPHVAVSRPDALAFRAARQLEVARNTSRASSGSRSRGLDSPPRLPKLSSRP